MYLKQFFSLAPPFQRWKKIKIESKKKSIEIKKIEMIMRELIKGILLIK